MNVKSTVDILNEVLTEKNKNDILAKIAYIEENIRKFMMDEDVEDDKVKLDNIFQSAIFQFDRAETTKSSIRYLLILLRQAGYRTIMELEDKFYKVIVYL